MPFPTPADIAEMDSYFEELVMEQFFDELDEGNTIFEDEEFRRAHELPLAG